MSACGLRRCRSLGKVNCKETLSSVGTGVKIVSNAYLPFEKPMTTQRKARRERTHKSGTIILGKNAHIPCVVRNFSEIGACLVVPATFAIFSTLTLGMPRL